MRFFGCASLTDVVIPAGVESIGNYAFSGCRSITKIAIPASVTTIGEGNGNPLQCCCLANPRDGGAWWAAVYGVTQSWTQLKRLSSSSSSTLRLK